MKLKTFLFFSLCSISLLNAAEFFKNVSIEVGSAFSSKKRTVYTYNPKINLEKYEPKISIIEPNKNQYYIHNNPQIYKNITISQNPYQVKLNLIDSEKTYLAKKLIGIDSTNYDAKINNAYLGEINPLIYNYIKKEIVKVEDQVAKNRMSINELKNLLLEKYNQLEQKVSYKNDKVEKLIKNYYSLVTNIERKIINLVAMYKSNNITLKEFENQLNMLNSNVSLIKNQIYSTIIVNKELKDAYNKNRDKFYKDLGLKVKRYKSDVQYQKINKEKINNILKPAVNHNDYKKTFLEKKVKYNNISKQIKKISIFN